MYSPAVFRAILAVVLGGALLGGLGRASAQTPDDGAATPNAARSGEAAAASAEVSIRVETFGVGDAVRPGEWAGLRVALRDQAEKPRWVAVRLHMPDADGDTALYTRVVTSNPGAEYGVWLYARLPWDFTQGSVLRVSVSEATPQEDGTTVIGRQLAWKPITASRVVASQDAMAGLVGTSTMGLEQYSMTFRDRGFVPGSHEVLQVVSGLRPDLMPDQWVGLAAFDTLVWADADPSTLEGELRPAAIREWVHRGGHLVVIVPEVGATWSSPTNPLASLLPSAKIEKVAEADLKPYSMWLTGTAEAPLPSRVGLHRFVIPPDTEVADATPLITGPQGVVAVRRLVGTGMVTLVGIDIDSRGLAQGQVIRADAFWPRLIGRRGLALSAGELELLASRSALGSGGPPAWVDERVGDTIAKGRQAGLGLALGVSLFMTYWLVAGPLGYKLLQMRGLERHAWLGFVLIASLFTLVAWFAAGRLRPKQEQAWHYTLIDHVYGQPVQRARSFVSVLFPEYGQQRVRLGSADADESWNQALTPWADPVSIGGVGFPDARGYELDVRRMTDIAVPSRSTIKSFQADWLGGPRWSMFVPPSLDRAPAIDSTGRLAGAIENRLPDALNNVLVIFVKGQVGPEGLRRADVATAAPLVADAYAWRLKQWEPGTTLELAAFVPDANARATDVLGSLVPRLGPVDTILPTTIEDSDLDEMVSLFGVLDQPDPAGPPIGSTTREANVRRRVSHTLDLAKWFTQPCLIVIGHVADAPTPIPLSVDGNRLDGKERGCTGRTVVRWVYPLRPAPAVFGGGPGAAAPRRAS